MTGAVLAWGLSVLPLVGELVFGLSVPGASRTALVLLPWIALSGVPRAAAGPASRGARVALDAPRWVLLALPPLALGAALDARAGLAETTLAAAGALGLALVLLGALAASGPARRGYGLAWALAVPGSAALLFALRFAALPGSEPTPSALGLLERVHPLAWLWSLPGEVAPWPLVSVLLLLLLARGRRAAAA